MEARGMGKFQHATTPERIGVALGLSVQPAYVEVGRVDFKTPLKNIMCRNFPT
jgi:hypothetical protein